MSQAVPSVVTIEEIRQAARRIDDLVMRTPIVGVPHTRHDSVLACKAESLQPTGAFKLRGAYNAIDQVMDRAQQHGVVAQSSGNHARAVAWLSRRLGVRAVIVMPEEAPTAKVDAVRAFGVDVELVPARDRDVRPLELASEHGYVHVPPYDHPHVIAGQGTIGLEILEQVPDVERILVPVSGGGLISGISTAVKALRPQISVVGVEPELAADAAQSLREGQRTAWEPERTYRTIADGLRTPVLGMHPWEHIRRYVDDIVTVRDAAIRGAMKHLALAGRLVAEPAGAVAVAAWLAEQRSDAKTVAVVSGGSVDPTLFASVLTEDLP